MKIRKANEKDIDDIDKIYEEASMQEVKYQFPNITKEQYEKDLKKYKISRKKGFIKNIKNKNHYWIVVEEKGEIIGFGEAFVEDKKGKIENIYVKKNNMKKGVGSKILSYLIKWIKKQNIKDVESSCYINNKPSIKLHEKFGFKPIVLKMKLVK
ncbi:MAG: N-acetyltransferase family protein [Nanoarchaeota archaeon]